MSIPVRTRRALAAATAAVVAVVAATTLGVLGAPSTARGPLAGGPDGPGRPGTLVLPRSVRASMNREFIRNNEHWDELTEMNTLEQMMGSAGPTQREYLGCLQGDAEGPVVRVTGWTEAAGLRQLQFWVTGNCEGVRDGVGTWHTHPYKADPSNRPIRQRGLSRIDLDTFSAGEDLVTLVVWDVDSIEAAVRLPGGEVLHPAEVVSE